MVIDCHAHIFPESIVDRAMQALGERYGAQPVARPTPDELLRHMDSHGVDRACVLGVATKPSQVTAINDWLISLNEPRLIPFGSLHPYDGNLESEVARLLGAGVRAVKLQPHFQGFELEDPRTVSMFEVIGDRLIVLLHGGQEIAPIENLQPTPARLLSLHRQFPQVRFILAHLGAYQQWDEVEQMLVGTDVWLDASYVFGICPEDQITRIIACHGVPKIVWGSDFPWQTQGHGLEGVRRLGLSVEDEAAILGGNVARLLGI